MHKEQSGAILFSRKVKECKGFQAVSWCLMLYAEFNLVNMFTPKLSERLKRKADEVVDTVEAVETEPSHMEDKVTLLYDANRK